jgi:polysaccharide deacetylase family protein (PEP-CTERM system associated)
MLNILTIDIEDYFQVHAFSDVIKFENWGNFECRIECNTDRLLNVLSSPLRTPHSELRTPIHATFFVLGWIAERYPDLVRRIQKEGHEIACHGYAHRLVYTQSRDEFRQDITRAKSILEDITSSEVIGYRAPSYSITSKSQWAFEILMEEGFKYDSSIFPIHHDFYGMPDAPRFPFAVSLNGNSNVEFSVLNFESNTASLNNGNTAALDNSLTYSPNNSVSEPQTSVLEASKQHHGNTAALDNSFTHSLIHSRALIEFPISTVKFFGQNFPISGGGYFRLFPYSLIRKGLRSINQKENKPFIFYAHPWEFDTEQPRIKGAANLSKFRHYVNLDKTESKFRRLLGDFQFSTIRQLLIQNS